MYFVRLSWYFFTVKTLREGVFDSFIKQPTSVSSSTGPADPEAINFS